MNKPWKDSNGNCKCESCGKCVPENQLKWHKGQGFCKICYEEILKYKK